MLQPLGNRGRQHIEQQPLGSLALLPELAHRDEFPPHTLIELVAGNHAKNIRGQQRPPWCPSTGQASAPVWVK